MKVIVQDIETGAYLSANGRWVAAQADARDFFTLLRAYHFAKDNTARRFQVLLHCPDDQYSAGIITGVGMAAANEEAAVVPAKTQVSSLRVQTIFKSRNVVSLSNRFNWTRNDLN
jgi:hypothetical protein